MVGLRNTLSMLSLALRARTALLAILFTALGLGLAPAWADEVIRQFTTNTTLRADSSVDVVETITVHSEGNQIRHGIYRDIPVSLINDDKSRVRSDLRVIAVKRDNAPEPFDVEGLGTGFKRIKIGDADTTLSPGDYTYTMHYTMSRMGRSFPDHDELYWNATGNYWNFPIESATATLNVPSGAKISGAVGYTGVPGSKEQNVSVTTTSDTTATFRSGRVLQQGEGMTVAVEFSKGVLTAPGGITAATYWLSDHREVIFPAIAVAILLLYNFFAWSAVGRDPRKGTIIPLFHPPADVSPALAHYISNMGFKKNGWTAFTASIFDLGVKGLVQIDKIGKSLKITSTGTATTPLPAGESSIYDYLHAQGSILVDKSTGPGLNTKRGEFVSAVTSQSGTRYFSNNYVYSAIGILLAVGLLAALVWLDVLDPFYIFVAAIAGVVLGVGFGVLFGARNGIVGRLIGGFWVAIFAFNFLGGSFSLASGIRIDTGLIAAVSIILIEIIFTILMRAPTIEGRKLMDQIEGFKMYLNTAEKNRLNFVGEPQMSVTRFESILPFAIALGVEKPWSQRFEADLARNAVAGATAGYSPIWYTGSDWNSAGGGFGNTVSSIASGMSAAMIAAQPSTSSGSSFGGGGGSSGGGGGGGGGGGW